MDPSIFKLLEEDEDESMHSGADVDAFQAALNRDIEGSASLPTNPPGNSQSPNEQFTTWTNGIGDSNMNLHTQHSTQIKEEQQGSGGVDNQHQRDLKHLQHNHPQDLHQAGQRWENPSQVTGLQNPTGGNEPERPHNQETESQYSKLQKMTSQQPRGVEQPVNPMNRNPKQVPFAALLPSLIAQLDKDRAMQLRTLYSRLKKNEIPKEGFTRHVKEIVGDQMLRMAVSKLQQSDPRGIVHLNQLPPSTGSSVPVQGFTNHPQHNQMQRPPSSFPMYTSSGSFHSFPGPSTNVSGSSLRPHLHDSHMRNVALNQAVGSTGLGVPPQSTTNMMTMPKFERPASVNDPSRVQGGATSHFQNSSSLPLNSVPSQGSSLSHVKQESVEQSFEQNKAASGTSKEDLEKESSRMLLSAPSNIDANTSMNSRGPLGTSQAGFNARMPPKKPTVGQKKPLETLGSSPPPPSKKQKVVQSSMDQSIEQLNDVTAVSGVNLRRVDTEKSRHRTFITSDIRLQINEMNQKVKEEWEKKQAEAEKLKKPSDSEDGDSGVDGEKEKEDNRSKGLKGNKEDDDKMRTTAANVAARAAVGGDDTFLKWQLMAEARQKSVSETGKDGNQKTTSGGGRNSKERQDGGRRFSGPGGRRLGKNQGSSLQPKVVRKISVKDVVAVLEREPQMSKSTLMYRLIQ
ncbi:hypothetical protein Bca4012_077703 [Brassica carinata]